jgi:hypothetical protein
MHLIPWRHSTLQKEVVIALPGFYPRYTGWQTPRQTAVSLAKPSAGIAKESGGNSLFFKYLIVE